MKKFFLPLLFSAIILGILVPEGQYLKPILPWLLSTLLFFNFYTIDFKIRHCLKREVIFYLICVLGLAPALIFVTTRQVSYPFRLGIFLAAISPAAISSSIVVRMLKGSIELSIANIVLSNLLSPFSYSLLLRLYFTNNILNIAFKPIIVKLMLFVFVPFLCSLVLKKMTSFTPYLQRFSAYMNLLFMVIVFIAISSSSKNLRTVSGGELVVVILFSLIVAMIFYSIGFLLGTSPTSKKALSINMGHKNQSLCIWLALSNFDPLTAIPATVYLIIHHFINLLLLFLFSRKKSESLT